MIEEPVTLPRTLKPAVRAARRASIALLALALAAPAAAVVLPAPSAAAAPAAQAEYGAPDAIAADYYGALLRHTRWAETVWDASAGVYRFTDFNFAVVLGNAVLVTHGEYDEQLAGVSKEVLKQKTVATITHYAALNRFVNPNGTWGKRLFWDSTFQSYFLVAGRLLWDDLDATTRANLTTIAAEQSRYTADLEYGKDPLSGSWTADWPDGKYEGDTAQEEVGVYTQALAPGLAWAPQDADAGRWAEQLADWGRNAAGQPTADRNNPALVAGKPISSNTMQNIRDTYLVENHGSFGPHYQSDIWRSGGRNAIQFIVNDQPLPEILTRQPNAAELWESIKLVMSDQGEPFMPMVADREYLYGRDVLPIAFLGQVLRDPDAVRAEANLAAALEDYQAYAPADRLTKFSGEPKYEPEARAEIAISYLLHVEAAESEAGVVEATPQDDFFARLSGTRDFGADAGLTVQQSERAWAAASSRTGFVKFPWVPAHNSWMFDVSGNTPYLYPRTGATVDARSTERYTAPGDGFDGTASLFRIGGGRVGHVTLPTGSAIYASSGAGRDDAALTVRNLQMGGYAGLDGSRTYTSADGETTETRPATRPADARDANAARIDDLAFAPSSARYVRMQGVRGNASFGYSMYKFHVYGADAASTADLAAGRTATASSQDTAGGRTAARVTEASPTARWAVATGERTRADSWIQVDLGSSQTVGAVRLAWESSAGSRYLIQTSENGTDWTTQTAYGAENAADANVARLDTVELTPAGQTEPAPVTTRYVRMQGVQGNPSYGYSLYHLRAFTPGGEDAARGKPATASSVESAARAAGAVTDGSATTRWSVANAERTRPDSWIQVDLGAPTAIAKVQLGWESAAGRDYRIQTSLDGETWTDAASYRFTGDQILSTEGGWLNVEGAAGFVVRGTEAPITVSRESLDAHAVRLADAPTGSVEPLIVEMVPGDAEATAAQAATPQPRTDTDGVVASTLDGYLSVFNLTGEDARVEVRVPHDGETAPLYEGTQRLDAARSVVTVDIPADTARVLAPRFEVPVAALATTTAGAVVADGRSVELTSPDAGSLEVRNVETGERRTVELTAGEPAAVRIAEAGAFPLRDRALLANTFPASVLPEGMTSPAAAVDGDARTAWTPGPDGRMVVDLGTARPIGSIALLWADGEVPAAAVSVSDDGLAFREVGDAPRRGTGVVEPGGTARYVAVSTSWSAGDAALTSLRVLQPGVVQDVPTGEIEGELPAWQVGRPATGSLSASGTPAPEFTVTDGALPAGVVLDASGAISGTPTEAGPAAFTVAADNGVGESSTRDFQVEVAPLDLQVVADPAEPDGEAGWYTRDVALEPQAEGVELDDLVEADVDGAGWAAVDGTVTVAGDGEHEVRFRALDESGGTLAEASWSGRIDSATPVTAGSVDEDARRVTLRSADATSGVERVEIRIGDGDWERYEGPVTVGEAKTVVRFRGIDRAGNVETAGEVVVPKAGVALIDTLTAAIPSAEAIRYHDGASVTVRVSGAGGTPTGTVTVVAGDVELGSAALVGGRAKVALDRALLLPGDQVLEVRYSGDARFAASADEARIAVAKAAVTLKASFSKTTITRSQSPKVKVVATSRAPITGTVSVTAGSRTYKADVRLVDGRATFTMPKLKAGSHKFVVRYSGTATTAAAKSNVIKVRVK
ncbi:discoidin domain-containing protein [Homoserinibacter sp. YIM 151385]|uniref:discoidin domain-containing protein n=1 Tax=Homoserinibacter sp. YIM 151385 TaxID=2985506 RepID=UPI0022F0E1CA|nr:discoidin domain-containing protein [Homoserinibacter sp. YIM 151385]WBU37594.1 discoidin domain-containing protein [Homoserinibacter sp. YIM 151385]